MEAWVVVRAAVHLGAVQEGDHLAAVVANPMLLYPNTLHFHAELQDTEVARQPTCRQVVVCQDSIPDAFHLSHRCRMSQHFSDRP